jgi:hypothetical protein
MLPHGRNTTRDDRSKEEHVYKQQERGETNPEKNDSDWSKSFHIRNLYTRKKDNKYSAFVASFSLNHKTQTTSSRLLRHRRVHTSIIKRIQSQATAVNLIGSIHIHIRISIILY